MDWHGPDGGPTGVLGKGLAVAPARVLPWRPLLSPARLLPGALWSPLAGIPPRVVIFYSVYLILKCLHKDLHATTGMPPESLPHGGSGLKGDSLHRCGASCHGKGLAGFAKTAPRQGSCRGVRFVPFALCGLGLGVVLLLSRRGLTLAHLPCLAQCGGVRGSDCPCTVIGVQKVYPSFCTPTMYHELCYYSWIL